MLSDKNYNRGGGAISGDQTKWGRRGVLSNTSADQAGKVYLQDYIGLSYENRHIHIVELCIKITKF